MTCSFFKEENQVQMDRFLEANQEFSVVNEKMLVPDDNGYDGFYFAELRKN